MTVSRFHCLVEVDAPAVWVEDLGSLNGTYVNDRLIGHRVEGCSCDAGPEEEEVGACLLQDGDQLTVGGNEFTVAIDEVPDNVATGKFLRPGVESEIAPEPCLLSA